MNFLILDIRRERRCDECLFWRANNAGYTTRIESAGRYTEQQVRGNASYYDNKYTTLAIPEAAVLKLVVGVVPHSNESIRAMRDARNAAKRKSNRTAAVAGKGTKA